MQTVSSTTEINIKDLNQLSTIDELVSEYSEKFTKPQLQWALRFRDENGLEEAVIKLGRRLYLHKPTFLRWLVSRRRSA